jgi:hypothetical protein
MALLHNWAHQLLIDVLGAAGDIVGERRWQSRGGVAVGARILARIGAGLNNVRHG